MKKQLDYASLFTLRSDGRYMGYWKDQSGKRHAIYDRDPARLYEKIIRKETPQKTTLSAVLDAWEQKHRDEIKAGTWSNYAPHIESIKSLYGDKPVEDISAFDVTQDLQAAKAKGYSFTVVNSRRCIWRMAMDYAVADKEIRLPYNPALSVKNPKGLKKGKRHVPEDEAIKTILREANSDGTGFIACFLLCTGLRRSEALHRRKADVDTKTWEINVPTAKTEAGVRSVPIIEPLQAPLMAWMKSHPGEWLFPHVDYAHGKKAKAGYMTDSNWTTAWLAYCKAHGWLDEKGNPAFGAHNLRHGTATMLIEAGVDPHTAQRILGHASVKITMDVYAELREKQKVKSEKMFSNYVRCQLSCQDASNA